MCGIAGFCNIAENWEENIKRMNDAMIFRGPDYGSYISNETHSVVLGHRRLSIMDITETGHQPMKSHSGKLIIVYNGEIYNHPELRDKLEKEGHVKANEWRGNSDTEIMLEAFEAYGVEETLRFCKGMWAFALYNTETKEVKLSRDRIGEKPLYYGYACGGFVFASDIACIEALPAFDNDVCREILDVYFEHGYIPKPFSIYRDIYKLEPGTVLTLKAPYIEYTIDAYWSMIETAVNGQEHMFRGSFEEASEQLESLLKASVKGQMISDVPLGAFLSAGIDSSTIVSLMQDLSGSQKVKTFTIGVAGNEEFNEAKIAKEIANHLGTEHTELYLTDKDILETIPKLGSMFREPFADSSQIPTYIVSGLTRRHVTVSLSGDGGDELFSGYNSYASVSRIWNKTKMIPKWFRTPAGRILEALNLSEFTKKAGWLVASDSIESLYIRDLVAERTNMQIALHEPHFKHVGYTYTELQRGLVKDEIHRIMLMDMLMYHPDDILVKVDRCGMAVSLETRIPMLDRDVVEFAWTLPLEYLRENGIGKKVLRDVLYRYVPKEMMDRPKKGFSIPIADWLKNGELREWAESLLAPDRIAREGYLNPKIVERYWRDYIDKGIWRVQIWYILMFQTWLEHKNKR